LTILAVSDRRRLIISRRDLPYFLVLGCIGVVGVQFTYYFTISKINVGPAVLIQYLALYGSPSMPFSFRGNRPPGGRSSLFSLPSLDVTL
jgi:drug/metabolite transporter (DMT)-like permease